MRRAASLPEADIERKEYKELRKSKVASYDTACTICFEEYTAESEIVLIKNCKHFFHYACLNQWFKTKKTCPLDRKPITANNMQRFRPFDSFVDSFSELEEDALRPLPFDMQDFMRRLYGD